METKKQNKTKEQCTIADVSNSFCYINVYSIGKIKAMKAKTFQDILKCKRLFFNHIINYSQKTDIFIEIKDVPKFIETEKKITKREY